MRHVFLRKRFLFFLPLALLGVSGIFPSVAYAADNLVPNPSVEISGVNGAPQDWARGKWGTNQAVFTYPVQGLAGQKAVSVQLTQRTSGDAKWYVREIAVNPNQEYTFSGLYTSNVSTFVTVQYRLQDNSLRWVDIARPVASAAPKRVEVTFTTPANVQSLTIFHLINVVGTLTVDDFSLTAKTPVPVKGMVTLNFDDGWRTTFDNALPILKNAGILASHYVVTGRFNFPAYIDQNQVKALQAAGHEVGSHTRTHRDLSQLSLQEMEQEVSGSKSDLAALGIVAKTFAYPFGVYNETIKNAVKNAGYIGARSSNGAGNTKFSDRYVLARRSVDHGTTFAQVKAWIDNVIASDQWLMLVFHRVDTSGTAYATTPAMLQQIVDYLKTQQVKVLTTQQAIATLFQ